MSEINGHDVVVEREVLDIIHSYDAKYEFN